VIAEKAATRARTSIGSCDGSGAGQCKGWLSKSKDAGWYGRWRKIAWQPSGHTMQVRYDVGYASRCGKLEQQWRAGLRLVLSKFLFYPFRYSQLAFLENCLLLRSRRSLSRLERLGTFRRQTQADLRFVLATGFLAYPLVRPFFVRSSRDRKEP